MPFVGDIYTKVAESTVAAYGAGQKYTAYPGLVQASNGDIIVAYSRATDHFTTRDGFIAAKRSTDNGATWGTEFTIIDTASDLRDPDLVRLANGNLVCSFTRYFSGDHESYVTISTDNGTTWGTPILVASGHDSWSFVCGRVVQLANGDLLLADYGRSSGDTVDRSSVSRSTDGGATWAVLADIDGPSFARNAQEPCLAFDAFIGRVWCAVRSDGTENRIYLFYSDDSGATWTQPASPILTNASGRPALLVTNEEALALAYRDGSDSDKTKLRWSFDRGASWSGAQSVNSAAVYEYASWWSLADGSLGLAWSVEQPSTAAEVIFQRMTPPPWRDALARGHHTIGSIVGGMARSGGWGL